MSYTPQGHTQKETSAQWEKSYQYNAAERLIKYQSTNQGQSSPALEASYRYDPFGRRIAKSVKEGGTTKTIYFVYSEQGLMGEADEAGKLTRAYGFNPVAAQQGLWSTDPIWQAQVSNGSLTDTNTRYHHLHTDHLGTPQLATTKEGTTSWKAASEAFGAAGILQNQSSITMNLRFPGQYYDQETNSHYNLFRDYKPNQGRYVQSDPIGTDGGINFYVYVNNKPLHSTDTRGLKEDCNCEDPPRPPPNGCGPSWFQVSDKPAGIDFSSCCNAHDICYATCRGPTKEQCDGNMTSCMTNECKKRMKGSFGAFLECVNYAVLYTAGILKPATLAFYLARKDCCP